MRKLATATAVHLSAAALLIQAMGLQLVCLCGACDLSHALGVTAPATAPAAPAQHACCHSSEAGSATPGTATPGTADGIASPRSCCGDDHALQRVASNLPQRHAALDMQHVLVAVAAPVPMPAAPPASRMFVALAGPRGPPTAAAVPIYLRHASFLI